MLKPIQDCVILYVEDDDGTACLFKTALRREAKILPQLFRVTDGDEAIAFLRHDRSYKKSPAPDLVMLDLNLPTTNGFDVLAQIRCDPCLGEIPVYVFTSSDNPKDRLEAVSAGATGYFMKGVTLDSFTDTAKKVCSLLNLRTRSCHSQLPTTDGV
jgi:chemotaxis family two-component system response regulator Rcp1